VISELVLVCVVREARIKGEGTPASRGTGCLEKGTSGGKKVVLLLQLCGVTRALACSNCKLNQYSGGEKSRQNRHTLCPDCDGLGDKLDLNTRDASGLG
jgi:hypothetical protein